MKLKAAARIQNNAWRLDPNTGFLRCTAAILREGVMTYRAEELADAEPPAHLTECIRLYVPPEELSAPDSIASLEGMPATIGHTWQTAGAITACGSVAGQPCVSESDSVLLADILITDPDAVRRIMLPTSDPDRLTEISSAGDWSIIWESGVAPDGTAYDGYFVKLRYNHVALLPAGAGRAGASVRIINEKESVKMDFTRVKYRGKTIRVANEDVEKVEEIINEDEAAVKNAVTPEDLQKALDELVALKAEVGEKNARISELEGTIRTYKDQLEAALDETRIEEVAADMAEEREEATAVMNSAGISNFDGKGLRGHALRTKVVNSLRVQNGKPELTADEAKDEPFVKGMYRGLVDSACVARKVPGAEIVQVQNQRAAGQPDMSNKADRFQRLYGKKQ